MARGLGIATLGATCTAVALCVAASAQQAPTFRGSVDVVPLHVSVTNQANSPILDLQATDFSVYDNGQRTDIAAFVRPPPTLTIKLLITDGERLSRHTSAVRRGAESLIALIQPEDRAGLGSLRLWRSPFVSDQAVLKQALVGSLAQDRPYDERPFDYPLTWTGVLHTVRDEFGNPETRDFRGMAWQPPKGYQWSKEPGVVAIVLFSSGMDYQREEFRGNSFQEALYVKWNDQIAADTVRAGVIVFGIGLDGTRDDKRLQKLSADSSGWFLQPTSKTNWTAEMERLVNDLRSRYVIGFVPTSLDGTDHKLEVKVSNLLARVRARSFYKTPSQPR